MADFKTRKFLNDQVLDAAQLIGAKFDTPIVEREIDLNLYTSSPSSYNDILRYYSEFACVYAYRGHRIGADGKARAALLVMGLQTQVDVYIDFVTNLITRIEIDVEHFRALRKTNAVRIKYYLMHGNEAASFFKYSLINATMKKIKNMLAARGYNYIPDLMRNDKKIKGYLEGRGNGFKLIFKRLKPGYGESKRNDASI